MTIFKIRTSFFIIHDSFSTSIMRMPDSCFNNITFNKIYYNLEFGGYVLWLCLFVLFVLQLFNYI